MTRELSQGLNPLLNHHVVGDDFHELPTARRSVDKPDATRWNIERIGQCLKRSRCCSPVLGALSHSNQQSTVMAAPDGRPRCAGTDVDLNPHGFSLTRTPQLG
jgi:hypothetical protein